MKILHLSTYDIEGGAARAAYRLHRGLLAAGAESRMLVQYKSSDDRTVVAPETKFAKGVALLRPSLDAFPLLLYPERTDSLFSPQWLPERMERKIGSLRPDLVNLHWVCAGFLRPETIPRLTGPIIWTLHDSWAFTGGCHIPFDCLRYVETCGQCPQIRSLKHRDISRRVWERKSTSWRGAGFTVVTPSRWLSECAKASSLFRNVRVEVIPNGIDLDRFKPVGRATARTLLNLPEDKHLLLFGSKVGTSDRNKGFHLLLAALKKLGASGWQGKIELMIFGASQPDLPGNIGIHVHILGNLMDEVSMKLAYAAADVFIAPSIQENLPNTVLEAIACGTPCVAFHIGGMPDMIEHEKNGYLSRPYDTDDLAHGIQWTIRDSQRNETLGAYARRKAEREFSIEVQARRYLALYDEILKI